jgi:hypothetical protein
VQGVACDEVGPANRPLRGRLGAEIHQDRAAASTVARFDVVENVADKPGVPRVETEIGRSLQHHARLGFPTRAAHGQLGDRSVRVMRAVIDGIEPHAHPRELRGKVRVHLPQVGLGEVAARDPGLIRDYDEPETRLLQTS